MDRFTRNYLVVLGVLVLLGGLYWFASQDREAGALNAVLRADPLVSAYHYPFRVQSVSNGVARMYTPRSAELSAVRFLAIAFPSLEGAAPDDPRMVQAQQELARVQEHARSLVLAQPDVESVRWIPDLDWYERRGVVP